MDIKKLGKNTAILLIVAIAFYLLNLPDVDLLMEQGAVGFRLSGFLPIASTLLFGPIGAFGCMLGNLFSDCMMQFELSDVFGSVGVFLMGWLPYKLWHSLLFFKKRRPAFFTSSDAIIKFVILTAVSAVCASAVGAIGGQLTKTYGFGHFFFQVALQYFDLSMMFGMLIIHVVTKNAKFIPHIPKNVYTHQRKRSRYIVDYCLIGLIVFLATLLYFQTRLSQVYTVQSAVLCWVLLGAIVLLALLPLTRREKACLPAPAYEVVKGLRRQVITGFLVVLCLISTFYGLAVTWIVYGDIEIAVALAQTLNNGAGVARDALLFLWNRVFINIAIEAIILIGILMVMIRWVDKRVTTPLSKTTDYANRFVQGENLSQEMLKLSPVNNEIDTLGLSINHMVGALRKYTEEIKEKTRAEQKRVVEMNAAHDIQNSMLPRKWTGEGFDLFADIYPAREVGGDFYDFHQMSQDTVFAAVADVTGKGVSAALFMARAITLVHARLNLSLMEMMTQVNQELAENNDTMMFVTMFACIVDKQAGVLRYVNAGHNPPVIHSAGNTYFLQGESDFVLGPVEDITYQEKAIQLTEDFGILLYTDGVVEAENTMGEFFGAERLLCCAEELFSAQATANAVTTDVIRRVKEFSLHAEQSDDITVLCLKL